MIWVMKETVGKFAITWNRVEYWCDMDGNYVTLEMFADIKKPMVNEKEFDARWVNFLFSRLSRLCGVTTISFMKFLASVNIREIKYSNFNKNILLFIFSIPICSLN